MPIPNSEKKEKSARPQIDCKISIYQVEDDGLIVKVVPPTKPLMNQSRGPVEIVLLIDVSGSMNDLAPVPPSSEGEESEQKGLTVLDLTRHVACTIAESLNEHDTLCIVTFSTDCASMLGTVFNYAVANLKSTYAQKHFLARLPANKFLDDPLNLGLIQDLIGAENKKGEVELALRTVVEPKKVKSSWEKWGCHYLSSFLMAHQFQKCFSFKDPGTQRYGKSSQLFRDQLDVLDNLFDSLPAPPPSRPPVPLSYGTVTGGRTAPLSPPSDMRQYRNVKSTCFTRHTRVLVVDPDDSTEKTIPIEKLRTGDIVKTLKGNTRAVRTVLKCHTDQTKGRTMTVIPVNDTTNLWLEHQAGDVANDHAINVEGLWGATMGHGLTPKSAAGKVDVRIHDFYGDWDAVAKSLDKLPKHDGLALGDGTTKDKATVLFPEEKANEQPQLQLDYLL
ncbi:Hh protein intein-like-domain-containing protein [Lineolata rhizophorae]|uniref:Hh protein intein-like-domain-containing protein n=1 Tax=Lineolata rhizophorae TaxID=578093 RepID=A0A6A6NKR7_9PEZI|nr:Hh protein intein-like-domain-containing protein [Lineolata rhizophorae]